MARIHIIPTPGDRPFGILVDQTQSHLSPDDDERFRKFTNASFILFSPESVDSIFLHYEDSEEDKPAEEFVQSQRCEYRSQGGVQCRKIPGHEGKHGKVFNNGDEVEWDYPDNIPYKVYRDENGHRTFPTCQVRSKTREDKLIQCDKSAGHSDCHRSNHETGYYLWRSDTSDYPVFHYTGRSEADR